MHCIALKSEGGISHHPGQDYTRLYKTWEINPLINKKFAKPPFCGILLNQVCIFYMNS